MLSIPYPSISVELAIASTLSSLSWSFVSPLFSSTPISLVYWFYWSSEDHLLVS